MPNPPWSRSRFLRASRSKHRLAKRNCGLQVVALEERCLLSSGALTEFPLPGSNTNGPLNIAVASNGNVWFTPTNGSTIDKMTPAGVVTSYLLTTNGEGPVNDLILAPDGSIWYTRGFAGGYVGHLASDGTVTEYQVAQGNFADNFAAPAGLAFGPDGNLWVSEPGADSIAKVTPTGQVTTYVIKAGVADVTKPWSSIVAGPDGAMWFTDPTDAAIGRITTSGTITLYPAAGLGVQTNDAGLTVGPDGALWFTDAGTGSIGRITTEGQISTYAIPGGGGTPAGITTGPDGALWFAESARNAIGRISIGGSMTIVPLPTYDSSFFGTGNMPESIAAGPDKAIWFSELGSNEIGRLDPSQLAAYQTISGKGTYTQGTQGSPADIEVATFVDSVAGTSTADYTAAIAWGDGTTSAGTVAAVPNGGFEVSGSHTYASWGDYAIDVNITATNPNHSTTTQGAIFVSPPVAGGSGGGASLSVGVVSRGGGLIASAGGSTSMATAILPIATTNPPTAITPTQLTSPLTAPLPASLAGPPPSALSSGVSNLTAELDARPINATTLRFAETRLHWVRTHAVGTRGKSFATELANWIQVNREAPRQGTIAASARGKRVSEPTPRAHATRLAPMSHSIAL